jgi:hypothetical protein
MSAKRSDRTFRSRSNQPSLVGGGGSCARQEWTPSSRWSPGTSRKKGMPGVSEKLQARHSTTSRSYMQRLSAGLRQEPTRVG